MATPHPDTFDIDVQALMRGLVHELRNPLSAILTASSLLPGSPGLDEETGMLLDVVTKEARRMNRILTEFSTFAKPPKPHIETVDVARLARELSHGEVQPGAAIEVKDELPPQLWALTDAHLTGQALRNILENAREALPGGGIIGLTGGKNGQDIWLRINDSGAGLSDQSLLSAFQPFYSNKGASTGLGLSIARVAMRAAGGECRIENAPQNGPQGAVVTIELPCAPSSQTEPHGETKAG